MSDQAEEQSNDLPELDELEQPTEDSPEETTEEQPDEESSFEDELDKLEQDLNPQDEEQETEVEETSEQEQVEATADEKELKETSPDTFVTEIDGKEVELVEAKFPNGQIGYIPKDVKAELLMQADYTRKTQELGSEKEKFTTERTQWEQDKKFFEYSLLVNEIGQPPLPTLYDAYADENGTIQEVKDPATGEVIKRYRVFNDPKEKAMADIELEKFQEKLNTYKVAKQNAETKNEQLINNFKTKTGKDDTYVSELITKVKPYLNTMVAKGLEPLPDDAIEFFDRAVNFDNILAEKLKEEKKKLLTDLETKDGKSKVQKQITPKRQAPSKKTDLYDDIEEMIKDSY